MQPRVSAETSRAIAYGASQRVRLAASNPWTGPKRGCIRGGQGLREDLTLSSTRSFMVVDHVPAVRFADRPWFPRYA